MAELYDVFRNIPNIVFKVYKSLILPGVHIRPTDKGWGDNTAPETSPMDILIAQLEKEDVERTSFYNLIQPTDIIILVKGVDVDESKEFDSSDKFQITHKGGSVVKYSVVSFDTDPAKALYLVLLRSTK